MARLIEIGKARHPAEREAQLHLRDALPASWYITTNIKEHRFKHLRWKKTHTEIDSILISPFGIFVIDFKSDRGEITPNVQGHWIKSKSGKAQAHPGDNPFEKGEDKQFALKSLLSAHDPELGRLWLNYLIVLTRGKLSWAESDIKEKNALRFQVAELAEIENKVRLISRKRDKWLTPAVVRKVVEALKGPKLPADLLESFALWGEEDTYVKGRVFPGIVTSKDSQGATIEIGNHVKGRLDASNITWRQTEHPTNLLSIGQKIDVKILDIDPVTHDLSLGLKQLQDDPLLRLSVGNTVSGRVIELDGDGANIDLGDLLGRLSKTNITWRQLARPTDLLRKDQVINTKIIEIDRGSRVISLGMKQLEEDPLTRLQVGGRLRAIVTEILDDRSCATVDLAGVFAKLDGAEISWKSKGLRPSELLSVKQEIEVQVLTIDHEARSVTVSQKCLLPNPWKEFAEKHLPGGTAYGVIKEKSETGLLITLDVSLEGSINASNLGWYRPAAEVLRESRVNDEIRVRVLDVDPDRQSISLGMLSTLTAERRRLQILLRAHLCDLASQPKLRMNASRAYCERGNSYVAKKEFDRAIEDYTEAVRLDPTYSVAYNQRGNSYYSKGDYVRAIENYDEAIRISAGSEVQYSNRASAYYYRGEFGRALEDYDRALGANPKYIRAWNGRGDTYYKRREYDSALKDYDQSIALNSTDAAVFNTRGCCYYFKGDYDRAIADFDEAIRLRSDSAAYYLNRGDSYRQKKEYERAINDYDKALRISPDYALAINARSALFREMAALSTGTLVAPSGQAPSPDEPKKLALQSRIESGVVPQGFRDARRTKAVVVEKRGRRTAPANVPSAPAVAPPADPPGAVVIEKAVPRTAPASPPAPVVPLARPGGIVLRRLTDEERLARAKALARIKEQEGRE
jgi:tetratricopeptide (TPR) repeat protein